MGYEQQAAILLVCAECGIVSDAWADGWHGYRDGDGVAVVFCPDRAEREFGQIEETFRHED